MSESASPETGEPAREPGVYHRWMAELVCVDEGGLENVVKEVRWRLSSIDTTTGEGALCTESSLSGTLVLGEPSPDSFVPAPDEVTHEVIRAWVNHSEGAPEEGYEAANAATLAALVAEKLAKPVKVFVV